jgi:phage gpG-like protein
MTETLISGVVVGGDRAAARFNASQSALIDALRIGIGRACMLVVKRTKEKLSDDVLHVRTGRLRRSIHADPVTVSGTQVQGIVGTNVEYAAIHEYGFSGVVSVRESLRTSVLGNSFTVRAHTRNVHLPERSFLRSALTELQPQIRAEVESAVDSYIMGMR